MDNRLFAANQRQRLFFGLLLLLLSVGVRPGSAQAQGTANGSGSVSGIVRNDQGDPVGGVTVVAKNGATGLSAGTQTDSAGLFRFPKLPVGVRYSFSFSGI